MKRILPSVPPGWKLVPEEPTESMWQAGREADAHPGDSYTAVYCAMLSASPELPAAQEPTDFGGHAQAIRQQAFAQAASVVRNWSLPTIQTPSMWLIDKAAIEAEILQLADGGGEG